MGPNEKAVLPLDPHAAFKIVTDQGVKTFARLMMGPREFFNVCNKVLARYS